MGSGEAEAGRVGNLGLNSGATGLDRAIRCTSGGMRMTGNWRIDRLTQVVDTPFPLELWNRLMKESTKV